MVRTYIPQKTAALAFRLRPEVKEALEKQATKEGVSVSSLAESCIEEVLRRKGAMR
jgi:predicted HicB family RNase H-like nuclease